MALFHVPLWVTWEWGGRPYVLPKEGGRAPEWHPHDKLLTTSTIKREALFASSGEF